MPAHRWQQQQRKKRALKGSIAHTLLSSPLLSPLSHSAANLQVCAYNSAFVPTRARPLPSPRLRQCTQTRCKAKGLDCLWIWIFGLDRSWRATGPRGRSDRCTPRPWLTSLVLGPSKKYKRVGAAPPCRRGPFRFSFCLPPLPAAGLPYRQSELGCTSVKPRRRLFSAPAAVALRGQGQGQGRPRFFPLFPLPVTLGQSPRLRAFRGRFLLDEAGVGNRVFAVHWMRRSRGGRTCMHAPERALDGETRRSCMQPRAAAAAAAAARL